jgi:hypothetical protein
MSQPLTKVILQLRGLSVVIDSDLAALYGVTTKRLNEQVHRNSDRFPRDFCFQLTTAEKDEVVANCDHLKRLKFSPTRPYAFTEHGALMAASVLSSERAVEVSVQLIRAFVELRTLVAEHKDLARRLDELELKYDGQFRDVFVAIRHLMTPKLPRRKPIGFR